MVKPLSVKFHESHQPTAEQIAEREEAEIQATENVVRELDIHERIEAVSQNLERVLGWVVMADNKVLIALTFQGGIVAGTAAASIALGNAIHRFAEWQLLILGFMFLLFIVAFLISLLKSFQAIFPSIRPLEDNDEIGHHFFYGAIASMSLDEYTTKMQGLDLDQIERGLIKVTYINAQIATEKFKNLRTAFTYMGIEVTLVMLTALLVIARQLT